MHLLLGGVLVHGLGVLLLGFASAPHLLLGGDSTFGGEKAEGLILRIDGTSMAGLVRNPARMQHRSGMVAGRRDTQSGGFSGAAYSS